LASSSVAKCRTADSQSSYVLVFSFCSY
jgi:hypothetical protein